MKKVLTIGAIFLGASLVYANAQIPADAKAEPASDAAVIAVPVAAPVEVGNKICPVSGEKIVKSTDMGEPVQIDHNGKIYGLCCPMCIKDFKKDPDKYAAIADQEVSDASVTP
ncbi:MAG TPA: TRASH domain-containing protein [Candidatus Omnitrophota bacterium]|nr:TRASH domain-containing protein [Candidatus Omnitrophota bacterium]